MATLNWKLLTAFEAVARHRNFTGAASELNVQQPSVSRRVAELEAQLGVGLILRTRPMATLTPDGELLFRAIAGGMFQIQGAIDQITSPGESNVVVVNTTIGFASCYLMQRLASFRAANPDIAVELVSRDQNETYKSSQADILIIFDAPESLPQGRIKRIFSEQLVPVSKPGAFPELGDALSHLASFPLLHLASDVHAADWDRYLSGTGIAPPVPRSDHRFTSFMVYLQAALNGEGIILGWEHLMQSHFDHGLLIRNATRVIETERGYFACLTRRATENRSAATLWTWLGSLRDERQPSWPPTSTKMAGGPRRREGVARP